MEQDMKHADFIYGYYLSKDKQQEKITSLADLDSSSPYWLHFDYTSPSTKHWFEEESQLPPVVINALLDEETRPRATPLFDGVLVSLRGVNLSPNSDPEDMVSIRLWFTKDKVISTRRRTLLSTKDIANDFDEGCGPQTPSEFISK